MMHVTHHATRHTPRATRHAPHATCLGPAAQAVCAEPLLRGTHYFELVGPAMSVYGPNAQRHPLRLVTSAAASAANVFGCADGELRMGTVDADATTQRVQKLYDMIKHGR